MIATGKSALFVNVTTTLIHQKYKTSSVCEPDNWEFNSKVKVAIMNYIDCYKPEYIILYCNQPNLSMRALNPDEFNILLSEISSELLKAICSQPTQRAYPNVISFCAKPGHP